LLISLDIASLISQGKQGEPQETTQATKRLERLQKAREIQEDSLPQCDGPSKPVISLIQKT
jgi:hypothetical protein